VSGVIRATYEIYGEDARSRATALAVEQSHELPTELAPSQSLVSLGIVVDFVAGEPSIATVEYPEDLAGSELPQLLVLLLGNVSLQDGTRLIDVEVPDSLVAALGGGTRLGAAGIRRVLGVHDRPLLATALKPVGLGVTELAAMATELALGGIDVIKDDQGLANQPWAPYRERVLRVAEAVRDANEASGNNAVYLPALSGPVELFDENLALITEAGAGGALLMPGISGFDSMRRAARVLHDDAIILAHPSFLGGFTASGSHGIAPEVIFGPLMRLAGADTVVFPSWGGRFSLSREQCAGIAASSRRELNGVAATLPAPGGGMSIERVPELVELYGTDVLLLIGADLHRGGDLRASSARFREAAVAAS
jgi:ribulose-bisphosphate carboxylase large chain